MQKTFFLSILFLMSLMPMTGLSQTEGGPAKTGGDATQKVEITAGSYFFEPKLVVVKINVPVELIVKKEPGLTPHNITLSAPEAGIDFSEFLSTDPITIKFTPTKAGQYTFYCNKKLPFSKSHREKGMEGILEVKE